MNSIVFQVLLFALILVLVIGFWAVFGLLEEIRNHLASASASLSVIADEVTYDIEEVIRK